MHRRVLLLVTLGLLSNAVFADTITCLGRIEPMDGVRVISGPSNAGGASSVIVELKVEEGDWVEKDQLLAVLDDFFLHEAELQRQEALLEEARVELNRLQGLSASRAAAAAN